MPPSRATATDAPAVLPGPVLLYDGTCGFCSTTVQLILRHDRQGTLRFAALQSRFGSAVLGRHPELHHVDSIVWLEPARGARAEQVTVRSGAALRVAGYLGGWWRLALVARLLPRSVRDRGYDFIARHRHQLPGGRLAEQCVIPPPDARRRFIEG